MCSYVRQRDYNSDTSDDSPELQPLNCDIEGKLFVYVNVFESRKERKNIYLKRLHSHINLSNKYYINDVFV